MLTVTRTVSFVRGPRGRKQLTDQPPVDPPPAAARIPRIARLMALALRFEELVRTGEVADRGALARAARVTESRVTQVLGLCACSPRTSRRNCFSGPRPNGAARGVRKTPAIDLAGTRLRPPTGRLGGDERASCRRVSPRNLAVRHAPHSQNRHQVFGGAETAGAASWSRAAPRDLNFSHFPSSRRSDFQGCNHQSGRSN